MGKSKIDQRYEAVYRRMREAASEAARTFQEDPDAGVLVANAQAEALTRTIRGFTLRKMPKVRHAHYIHWLFSRMLIDCIEGLDLDGRILVVAGKKKK